MPGARSPGSRFRLMPRFETAHFGVVDYQEESVLLFPVGLPAFEEERRFLPIEQPSTAPVIFLQSLNRPQLVFVTLPVLLVDPNYTLHVSEEDLQALGLETSRQPALGAEVACLTLITLAESRPPSANLLAPILINLQTRTAVQAIFSQSGYTHQHPLATASRTGACSSSAEDPENPS